MASKNKYRSSERDEYYEGLEEEFKNKNREPEENPENPEEIEENKGFQQEPKNKNKTPDPNDEVDWKKRYGDLQRHLATKENEWKTEKSSYEERLQALEEKASLPKNMTPEQLEEWEKKFPDVAAIIDYRAKEMAKEMSSGLEQKVSVLEENKQKLDQERAILQLISIHNDFIEVRDSEEFSDWLEEQSSWMKKAIYEPEDFSDESVDNAARVIKFFKLDTGWGEKPEKPKKKSRDTSAAETVRTRGSNSPDTDEQPTFSESMISKMSPKEFEKNREAILSAQRSGKFVYDMTGAAR